MLEDCANLPVKHHTVGNRIAHTEYCLAFRWVSPRTRDVEKLQIGSQSVRLHRQKSDVLTLATMNRGIRIGKWHRYHGVLHRDLGHLLTPELACLSNEESEVLRLSFFKHMCRGQDEVMPTPDPCEASPGSFFFSCR